ncbi:MAG: hypothetical protein WD749_12870 [Phycisphaerales bacterium]
MAKDPGEIDPRSLDDTVADEELAPEAAEPIRHEAPSPSGPPSPPRRPPARRAKPEPDRAPEPELLGETVADAPALIGGRRKPRGGDDVDLNRIFDRLGIAEETPLDRYDPEAGRTNVAVKISAATEAVAAAVKGVASSAITTPFGRLVLSIFVCLAGVALTIAAVTIQDTWMIVGASVVGPIGLIVVYWRYQAWLGHKRYMYRLLESLGEDVSDFDPAKRYRRTRTTAVKKGRR